jgi:hypothetical protein
MYVPLQHDIKRTHAHTTHWCALVTKLRMAFPLLHTLCTLLLHMLSTLLLHTLSTLLLHTLSTLCCCPRQVKSTLLLHTLSKLLLHTLSTLLLHTLAKHTAVAHAKHTVMECARPGGLTLNLRGSWGTEERGWSSLALAAWADIFL